MKRIFLLLLLFCAGQAWGQASCQQAVTLTSLQNFCSAAEVYQTTTTDTLYWFKFTAVRSDVSLTVTGGTMVSPRIHLLSDCAGTELVGTGAHASRTATFYKGGLITGQEYYLTVSGSTAGTFQLCIDNRDAPVQAGQDCSTALLLCSTQSFIQTNVSGGGLNNDEAKGTCLGSSISASESNSVWYKWQAANSGTLVFTITPGNTTDDIDFVLFDMDTTNNCSMIKPINVLRCAAGHGVSNAGCPTEPIYYKVGLDFNETDVSEATSCGSGQNGKLAALDMQAGHYYALLINNFSSRNNSFSVDFTDQNGRAGTGEFVGPRAVINAMPQDSCLASQSYMFSSTSTGSKTLKWTFGQGASISGGTGPGPFLVSYSTPGVKTVTLEATSALGCIDITSKSFQLQLQPAKPAIVNTGSFYCIGDTLTLTTPSQQGLTYTWTGPDGFQANGNAVRIPVRSAAQAGMYALTAFNTSCASDTAAILIGPVIDTPNAAFNASVRMPARAKAPLLVTFINQSANADSYQWDFGDGMSSTETNPSHTYRTPGRYSVKLTAFNTGACQVSVIKSYYEILDEDALVLPSLITPNGDGINDRFVVKLTSATAYHIQVFNRWGTVLFESHSAFDSWDGTARGSPVPAGVYYYVITAQSNARQIKRSGSITLIR